ncbi:MAG: glutamine-hydrolyzing carbamoyl-phosphate synthase small subunit [Pseudomonadota bacterium]|nr:glutamine-hydrolyzing carbamoyl-phosphate synthase small subunit [Pseudomonadota bacterium]
MTKMIKRGSKAVLLLEDGTLFTGRAFGAAGEVAAEVVFNTSLSGYQEVLSDPSYFGQMVLMTYPQMGNYGVNDDDAESRKCFLSAFIVKEYCSFPSSWRSQSEMAELMARDGVIGLEGIDTRALTRHIREAGALPGIISTEDFDPESLMEKLKKWPGIEGVNLVDGVTVDQGYEWSQEPWDLAHGYRDGERVERRVVVYDFGVKYNILRLLKEVGCQVTVVPAGTPASAVLELKPDALFLSNGPGDPAALGGIVNEVQRLVGRLPICGICLGHQILGQALGGKTYKLKFGHHGSNHPVMDLTTREVEITAQNHGFCVDVDSLGDDIEVTHINLNDQTVEGLRHRRYPLFSFQYHPESSPGPHDSAYLFKRFRKLIDDNCEK